MRSDRPMISLDEFLSGGPRRILINGLKAAILAALSMAGYQFGTKAFGTLATLAEERMIFRGEAAQIELMRSQLDELPCETNNQVLDRAVAWNSRIVHQQALRQTWYYQILITNGWNRVRLLDVSHCKAERK